MFYTNVWFTFYINKQHSHQTDNIITFFRKFVLQYNDNMTLGNINEAYDRIISSLDKKELKSAFDGIMTLMAGCNEYGLQDELYKLEETYKYMLHYRIGGVQDPMQEQIYSNIRISAYELADKLKLTVLTKLSPKCYYYNRRILQSKVNIPFRTIYHSIYSSIVINTSDKGSSDKKMDDNLRLLFEKLWLSGFLTDEDTTVVKDILQDRRLPFIIGCQIVSALLLSLEEFFDKEKLYLLFDAANSNNLETATRALVAVLIVLYKYKDRTVLYPQLRNRLNALAESRASFTAELRTIELKFILSRETEKITRKLQDEIIPEMIKLNSSLAKKINLNDLTPEKLSEEMNPEWKNSLEVNDEINKKLMEFNELQKDGADVLHSTFIHLKNYPFFRNIDNWLMPFSLDYSSIGKEFDNKEQMQMVESMTRISRMCNSDKYSFFFSLMSFPYEMRKMMLSQIDEQSANILEQSKHGIYDFEENTLEIISGQYIQDLYRFHKLYPLHHDFDDIFGYRLDFHNLEILKPFLSDKDSLRIIAEYYLQKKYFQEALSAFMCLMTESHNDETLFQKTGYCRQMIGDIEGALNDYLHADLLNPNSKWVIRRIAGCYKTLKQPDRALEYYHRYETLSPDNLSIQISIGHCHLELKNYNEALKYYYKVDYLDTESHKAWRPIAWCSFLTGRYDQARNYYKKILSDSPSIQDFINAGHTEWVLQNMQQALTYYKQAIETEKGNWDSFYEQFRQDIPELEKAGIEADEIPLVLDQLRYLL